MRWEASRCKKCIQNFSRKSRRNETTSDIRCKCEADIKTDGFGCETGYGIQPGQESPQVALWNLGVQKRRKISSSERRLSASEERLCSIELNHSVSSVLFQNCQHFSYWICKVKVKLSLCFNWAPRHGGVLGSGGIAPLILWPQH